MDDKKISGVGDTDFEMCKFAYYPNGYFMFPGYERTKFMMFPTCYEE